MTLKAFSPIPSWLPPFSTVPRGQLITIYACKGKAPFGTIETDEDHLVWQPSRSGKAVTKALALMKEYNKIAVVEDFRILPDCIQVFILYRKYHQRLPEWFIRRLKNFLTRHITGGEIPTAPMWKQGAHTQLAIPMRPSRPSSKASMMTSTTGGIRAVSDEFCTSALSLPPLSGSGQKKSPKYVFRTLYGCGGRPVCSRFGVFICRSLHWLT